jgi:hypothetical protein
VLPLGVEGFILLREKLLVKFNIGSVGESGSAVDDPKELALYELIILFILLSSIMELLSDPILGTAGGGGRVGMSFLDREFARRSGDPVDMAPGSSTGTSSRYIVFAVEDICRKCCENSRLGIGETGLGMTM